MGSSPDRAPLLSGLTQEHEKNRAILHCSLGYRHPSHALEKNKRDAALLGIQHFFTKFLSVPLSELQEYLAKKKKKINNLKLTSTTSGNLTLPVSARQTSRVCIFNYACTTLTLIPWPWYWKVTWITAHQQWILQVKAGSTYTFLCSCDLDPDLDITKMYLHTKSDVSRSGFQS